jgi:hypothetical protein
MFMFSEREEIHKRVACASTRGASGRLAMATEQRSLPGFHGFLAELGG